ncbi:MAG: glycosyltransferase family 4 protein [Treponema phagedenis]|uniref:glycosyltransferase family 4 protein n=1 Tax=Treponema phagedenis TaxID=162 RepID=UPI003133F6C0
MKKIIAHLTSAHQRYDTRIFIKMCSSLARNENYSVNLVVADGKGDEIKNSVKIIDAGAKTGGRLSRMTKTTKQVFKKALELNADIYHFHDPELLTIAKSLQKTGAKVIFDSHEDVAEQILGKSYIPQLFRKAVSKAYKSYENSICKNLDAIITATPYINNNFLKINQNSININNYPILDELMSDEQLQDKENAVCYVGGMTEIRGVKEIVKAMEFCDAKLYLAGQFSPQTFGDEVRKLKGFEKVDELGFLDRVGVAQILAKSKAGLVTFLPYPNHINAQPNKLFEYLSAGLPVIASNFSLWREIIEKNNCGICVDPLNPEEIAKAINFILSNPQEAKMMGENGRKAVENIYNWGIEEQKLLSVYKELLK